MIQLNQCMSAANDLINKLQLNNNQHLIDVWVPSCGRVMKFRQLSVRQQRDIIKTGVDGAVAGLTLGNVLNDVVRSNCTESYNFLVIDRFAVMIALRRQAFGDKFETDDTVVDLSKFNATSTKFDSVSANCSIESITVAIEVPSLNTDSALNTHLLNNLKRNDVEVSDAVGSLYVYEIAKFVASVQVGESVVEFKQLPIDQQIQIIENMPAVLNQRIVEHIQAVRDKELKMSTVDGVGITVDARLFT